MEKFCKVILKVEYQTISHPDGSLNEEEMERMAVAFSNLFNSGKQLLIVSSGAIALGSKKLKLESKPTELNIQQAVAAVGQAELIRIYQKFFIQFNQRIAQVLLTNDITEDDGRKDNVLNTFDKLFEMNVIPVINENDAVSTDDIQLQDNYALTKNVGRISNAHMIIFKDGLNDKYYVLERGKTEAYPICSSEDIQPTVEAFSLRMDENAVLNSKFPSKVEDIKWKTNE